MKSPLRAIAMALIVLAAAACGAGTPGAGTPAASSTLSTTATAAAATYEESSAAFCASFGSLIRAVGNPDTNTPSVLSKSLDDAVAAGDVAKATVAAATIKSELEAGRQQAATAARWLPAASTMAAMDRVLVAFEAQVAAKLAVAGHVPGANPQTALEQAGGVEAWTALLQGAAAWPVPSGPSAKPCPAFSGTP